jgi:hypothetical protein
MPNRAVVQSWPRYRLKAAAEEEFNRGGSCRLLRYTQALLTQMSQTAVCNRHHRRPAAVPLAAEHGPPPSNELTMTQS